MCDGVYEEASDTMFQVWEVAGISYHQNPWVPRRRGPCFFCKQA